MGGVARRAWARNKNAMSTSKEFNAEHSDLYHITIPYLVEDALLDEVLK